MLKFLVKVFMSLYLLKLLMDLLKMVMDEVDTLHVVRYWSEVLCFITVTHLGELEGKVKVTDLKFYVKSFWLKFLEIDIS